MKNLFCVEGKDNQKNLKVCLLSEISKLEDHLSKLSGFVESGTKNDKSSYICSMGLKGVLVKYEKYFFNFFFYSKNVRNNSLIDQFQKYGILDHFKEPWFVYTSHLNMKLSLNG